MIEPTVEMAEVAWDALPVQAQEDGSVDLDDMKTVLAAALALVERDYVIERRCKHGGDPRRCGPCSFDEVFGGPS